MDNIVSVIIPVYNVELYLDKCINSVIVQNYKQLEIILVDDGSPDNCPQMCDEWAKKDKRIKVIHKQNGGLSDARNAGLDICNGDYITFIDSDDFIPVNYIETLVNGIESTGADISACSIQTFTEKSIPLLNNRDVYYNWTQYEAITKMFYSDGIDVSACAKLYKNNLYKNICYPKGKLFEDMATTYKLFDNANYVTFCNGTQYYYFKRPESITTSNFTHDKMYLIQTLQHIMEHYKQKNKRIFESVCCRYFDCNIDLFVEICQGFVEDKNILWRNVRNYRAKVLFAIETPYKIRIKCLLTYLGNTTAHKILRRLIYKEF